MPKRTSNAIIVVVLLQLCCNNGQQQNETSMDSTDHVLSFGKITVAKRELSATLEKELTQRLKLGEITIAEIITQELRSAASIYEMSYNQAILSCGGCSELELLLILERANRRGAGIFPGGLNRALQLPYIEVPDITKDDALEKKLRDADAKYLGAFGKKRPWWWVCPDEEKLARTQLSLEASVPYPEYNGNNGEVDYRLGKAIAAYEMWFKRQPPKQDRLDGAWLVQLERAVRAESPILTEGEEAAMRAKYLKKFKRPITDFESSVVKVSLRRVFHSVSTNPQISVIRTATGASALYQPYAGNSDIVSVNPGSVEAKLSFGEWFDFATAIHKYTDYPAKIGCVDQALYDGYEYDPYWELELFFADADTATRRIVEDERPCSPIVDWSGVAKLMGDMKTKIKIKGGLKRQPKKTIVEQRRAPPFVGDASSTQKQLTIAKNPISATNRCIVGVKSDGTVVAALKDLWLVRTYSGLNGWNDIVAVSCGYFHIVGLKSNNTVITVGPNNNLDNNIDRHRVANWRDIVAVSAGEFHTLGLRSTGTALSTGHNYDGQCDVGAWKNIAAISAGAFHSLGLRIDGAVESAGANTSGQCDVANWRDIVAISAGRFHSVGVKSDGTVAAAGADFGGICSKTRHWENITAVAAGDFHTVGLRSDGTVVAVGDNTEGQCNVSGWSGIVAIAASRYHTVGLKSDGTAMAAGDAPAAAVFDWSGLDAAGAQSPRSLSVRCVRE